MFRRPTRIIGLLSADIYDDMLSRFDTIPECDRQTDGRTDGQNCYVNVACQRADVR